MTRGARRADAGPETGIENQTDTAQIAGSEGSVVSLGADHSFEEWSETPARERSILVKALAFLLIVLALGWLGTSGWLGWQSGQFVTLQGAVGAIPALSIPLVLLGLVWIMFGRTSRRETERFNRTVATMQRETASLEGLLGAVATRLDENHERLTHEASRLMSLGEEAADRLGRVAHYLAKESANLDTQSDRLENAAATARVDIGVLLHDLPRAEEQARAVAEAMKEAGLGAHEQAGALEGQLSALIARGRETDDVVGGAAQRLAAHIARIESTAATATSRMNETALNMNSAVDSTMARAAEAVDAARSGIDAQGHAMFAMIEQNRAALERLGEDASSNLMQRLEAVSERLTGFAEHLSAQDAASHGLVTSLSGSLAELEAKFAQLSDSGISRTEGLETSIEQVRSVVTNLVSELNAGTDRAADLIGRAQDMAQALSSMAQHLDSEVPAALGRVEEHAARTHAVTAAISPEIEAIRQCAETAATRITEAEISIGRQREAFASLISSLNEGLATADEQLRAVNSATEGADNAARRLVNDTGPDLIEALVRVRETAHAAAERAREAIAAVIPASAASLADASREAVTQVVSGTVNEQLSILSDLAERAVTTARRASDRLTRQMLAIGQTTAAIEARIEESDRAREEHESQNLSRRVALLMESLNSTAIDVTKILSNEVTDTAWTAYLRGDRGVFTRRAVRLLSSGEARQIAQHYEEEPEFREQVNRYIHDFESMLRRVLADRDGSPLGVALISSDMGKLYVALAQAIERLR
jgi:hypothetical protein